MIKVNLENGIVTVFHHDDTIVAWFDKTTYKIWAGTDFLLKVDFQKELGLTNNDWYDFKLKLQVHHNFRIGDEYKPDYIFDELVKVSDKFVFMDDCDCARWFKSQKINAEIGLDYIFIRFENSEHLDIKEKRLSFEFLKELSDKLECKFTITSFIPNENDDSFPWYCRKRLVTDKGILIELAFRKFGDSGGPIFSEDF
jgi:hypothetical protein